MSIKGILKAQIALRGLLIEWVNVRGFTEENPDESKVTINSCRILCFQNAVFRRYQLTNLDEYKKCILVAGIFFCWKN